MALLIALAGTSATANEALARKSGCLGCHAAATQLVGPSYKAVAERYAGQPDAASQLVAKVRKGGSGTWGEMAMPPQSGLSEADAKKLVTWILKGAR
jgi:cytochrome c